MSAYPYLYTDVHPYTLFPSMVLPILTLLIILAGGLALYFLFVRKPNRFRGAAAKLHDILNFRILFVENLLRVLYAVTVVGLAVSSLLLLFTHFFTALLVFVLGNLTARLVFELLMLLAALCRSAQEIDRKMGLPAEQAAAPQPSAMQQSVQTPSAQPPEQQ